jgi:hypothetical protein
VLQRLLGEKKTIKKRKKEFSEEAYKKAKSDLGDSIEDAETNLGRVKKLRDNVRRAAAQMAIPIPLFDDISKDLRHFWQEKLDEEFNSLKVTWREAKPSIKPIKPGDPEFDVKGWHREVMVYVQEPSDFKEPPPRCRLVLFDPVTFNLDEQ